MSVESGTASRRRDQVIAEFDFSAPPRMNREHSRTLEIGFETFARQWATQLSSRLRCPTDVALSGIRQEPYDTFAHRLATPTVMVVFSPDGKSSATSIMTMSPQMALEHLDHALGGPGGEQPDRELTDIEIGITQGMVERALGAMNYAFASVMPLTPRIDGIVQDPQLLQVARATDMMLLAAFEVTIGERTETLELMMPQAPLQQALVEAGQRESRSLEEVARAKESARIVAAGVTQVPVDVSFRLSPMTTSPDTVLGLTVGDLVRFTHRTDRPVQVMAGGTTVGEAVVTTRGNRRACLMVNAEENDS